MFRKLTIILISLSLCWTTLACSTPNSTQSYGNPTNTTSTNNNTSAAPTRLSDGRYPVQQATYDDINGEYTLMLLNTPPGTPPAFRTSDLQMARLTNEEIAAGQKSYLNVENGQPALHLTEDFKIEYVHNVTENQVNPQTGQPETVIVRQQSSFWTPFAGALAGQAIGSLLFTPRYYVPPVYQPGVILTGYGGYGNTYGQAVQQYQSRYQAPPAAVRNSQSFRTTGRLRTPSGSTTTVRRVPQTGTRSTGSGYGSSTLRRSNQPSSTGVKRSPSFGSSKRSSPSRAPSSFGSRKRR